MGLFDKLKKAFMGEESKEETKTSHQEQEENTEELSEISCDEPSDKVTDEVSGETDEIIEETSEEKTIILEESSELENEVKEQSEEIVEETIIDEPSDYEEDNKVEENVVDLSEESISMEDEEEIDEPSMEDEDLAIEHEENEEVENNQTQKYDQGLEKTRKTFGERLNELFAKFRHVDEDFFEELEDTLITSDVGFNTAMQLTDELREEVKLKNAKKPQDLQNTIIEKLVEIYEQSGEGEDTQIHYNSNGLSIILFVGVNGAGKTTTVGKLAHQLKSEGKNVILAAADTFRAGAIDQLVVWGERAEVPVIRGKEGGDPASVVFDAVQKAKEEQADILLVDTAGRLQNKVNLMNELAKIKRIIQREIPEAPHEVLLVLDATTGQNAMSQAKQFKDTTDVTGLVLTKLDGTAKGGIVLAIRNELHLPVKLVGLGEKINDLAPFDAEKFAYGLFKGLWKGEK